MTDRLHRGLFSCSVAILALAAGGCSLVVEFDRSRLDGAVGMMDAEVDGGFDAGTDAGPDAGLDGGTDAGPPCGNGVMDGLEACDDGNITADDGCSDTCMTETGWDCSTFGSPCTEICGDSMIIGVEACDDGFTDACGTCNADCTAVGTAIVCGDGMLCEETEPCDDGDTDAGDGCNATCTMIELGFVCTGAPSVCNMTCGNGALDVGEDCDDSANVDGDGCSAACRLEYGYACTGAPSSCTVMCGDGERAAGVMAEACDDSDMDAGDGCSATCTVEAGWTCMEAGMVASVCSETCGDTMVVGAEVCDDGNTSPGDGCSVDCGTVEVGFTCPTPPTAGACSNICNDGLIVMGETCDDMDNDSLDGCSATCQLEAGWTCTGLPSACTENCGDTMIVGAEVCDDGNTMTETECPYGMPTCTLCNATCAATLPLTGAFCGDRLIEAGEEVCDDGNASTCGTCGGDPTCDTLPLQLQSTGTLTITGVHADAELVTISDGVGVATFEIDDNPAATLVTGTVTDNMILWTAVTPGPNGNLITIEMLGGMDMTFSVVVVGNAITVQLATTLLVVTSTADDVKAGILGNGMASALVTAVDAGGDGSAAAAPFAATNLAGGDGDGVTGANVEIDLLTGSTNTQIRNALLAAIQGDAFLVGASASGADAIALLNDRAGSGGNVAIFENGANITAVGMTGGTGVPCNNGVGCASDVDCVSASCVAFVCAP